MNILVIGLGVTGQAALEYAHRHHITAIGYDDLEKPELSSRFTAPLYFKILPDEIFSTLDQAILSPGIPHHHALVLKLQAHQIPIQSDIEYFSARCPGKIIGITGSNGKSTVTALTTHLLNQLGYHAIACGNFGYPVMQLLNESPYDYYVVELSSYQLEWTSHLNAVVGCFLNISPNHLDRYHSIEIYQQAKERLLAQCHHAVLHTAIKLMSTHLPPLTFFSEISDDQAHLFLKTDGKLVSFYLNHRCLWTFHPSHRRGRHHYANQLAALGILLALGLDPQLACPHLSTFQGLPHRIEYVPSTDHLTWINDSKSTTTTATIAALSSVAEENPDTPILLILGGVFKEYDLTTLMHAIQDTPIRAIVTYGRDRLIFAQAFSSICLVKISETLKEAVTVCRQIALAHDIILLSPACASLDQFTNFEARGSTFKALITQ